MDEFFKDLKEVVVEETVQQYEDTSPSKSPTKEKTDDEDLFTQEDGDGIKEFDL